MDPNTATTQALGIFISSPGDVRPERLIAERVVNALAREFAHHFRLSALMWEREPLVATEHFQTMITPPREADVVVVILWSRLGTLLPEAQFVGAITGAAVTGTEWEFEDAVAAYRAHGRPDLLLYRKRAPVLAPLDDDDELERRRADKRRLDAFVNRWFVDADTGSFLAASHEFDGADAFEAALEGHLRALLSARLNDVAPEAEAIRVRWHEGSPYRGLQAFELAHAPVFFGRTGARNALRESLAAQVRHGRAFALVLGASGSGKSSLVMAGLLPDLLAAPRLVEAGVGLCRQATFRPSDTPAGPLAALAGAMLEAVPEIARTGHDAEALAQLLEAAPAHALPPLRQGLRHAAESRGLMAGVEARILLVLDQLEELFTNDHVTASMRSAFVDALEVLAGSGLAWIVATLRSDFFSELETEPRLARLSEPQGRYLLLPPTSAEVRQMIVRPALEAGLRFESDPERGVALDDDIHAAAERNPTALPLLAFALDQLWQRSDRTSGLLRFDAYASVGGLEGAIAVRAEEVFSALSGPARDALPGVLRTLVSVTGGPGGDVAARPVARETFPPGTPAGALMEAFLAPQARLLVADGDGVGARVRVAHEALLRHWPRARRLIEESREDLHIRARLEAAQARWREAADADRPSLLLNAGLPMTEAQALLARRRDELDADLIAYVERSAHVLREAEQRRTRRLRLAAAGFAMAALVSAAGAWLGFSGQREAERNLALAETQRSVAERESAQARRNLDTALSAIDTLVEEVAVGLKDMAGVSSVQVRRTLEKAESIAARLADQARASPQLDASRAEILLALSDSYQTLGDLPSALERAREARDTMLRLVHQSPDNAGWLGTLYRSHWRLGRVLHSRGELGAALEAHRAGLALNARVASATSDPGPRRNLYFSHLEIGDILFAQGQVAAALAAYREGLAIVAALADANPEDTEALGAVGTSHERIADVARTQGDLARAHEHFRRSLELRARLAAQSPDNLALQRDLSIALLKLGDVLWDLQDFDEGANAYARSLSVLAPVAARDPDNATWQADLAAVHERMSWVHEHNGAHAAASDAMRRSVSSLAALVAAAPASTSWKRDLAAGRSRLGYMRLTEGNADAAQAELHEALQLARELAAHEPSNVDWQAQVMNINAMIGIALIVDGNPAAAMAPLEAATALAARIARQSPDNVRYRAALQLLSEARGMLEGR